MKTVEATVHNGRVELSETTDLREGQKVIVLVPDALHEQELSADAMKLLARLDTFRREVGPVGCGTHELVRQGRRNGQ